MTGIFATPACRDCAARDARLAAKEAEIDWLRDLIGLLQFNLGAARSRGSGTKTRDGTGRKMLEICQNISACAMALVPALVVIGMTLLIVGLVVAAAVTGLRIFRS